jgi:two-component system response regulator (stage 0 sporulation protein F)
MRILIVDDDAGMADTLGDILEAKGYRVEIALDGLQALARLEAQPYHVIFLDIMMPQMNGLEVLRRVRRMAPETLVVMMTAYARPDLMAEAEREGALAVLAKPLPVDRLLQFLEAVAPSTPVLIVEDDAAFAGTLRDVLEAHGYATAYAADAPAALEAARRSRPDVVLLDLKLPVSNGYEVLRAILRLDPSTVVLLMTGYGQEMKALVDQGLRDGARLCLQKPFDPGDVLGHVRSILVEQAAGQLQRSQGDGA